MDGNHCLCKHWASEHSLQQSRVRTCESLRCRALDPRSERNPHDEQHACTPHPPLHEYREHLELVGRIQKGSEMGDRGS